jgi:S-formylglutathione hydrolase FrmB
MRILLAAVLAVLVAAAPAAAADELTVTREQQLSPRLREYGLRTAALSGETNLRVLLPDGYGADPQRRYPVLYLLHGCCDFDVPGSRAWTTHGEAEQATAGLPLIVVMPDGGRGGFYSDWYRNGLGGPPAWETYHMGQLVPWIDQHFNTKAAREGRVIAGLSMGGFGALSYAARHPDRFVAAASFSGAVDTNLDPTLFDTLSAQDGGGPGSIWGARATEETRWRAHNPWDLAENLAPLQLALRTGNGQPGPLDEPGRSGEDPIEKSVHEQTISVHERLTALGIAHTFDDYGPGTHSWPYWARDLRASLIEQMAVLASPPVPPARVTYRAAEPAYEVFGWKVEFHRSELAFSRLSGAGRKGFTLEGAGDAQVRTPALFRRGRRATVTIDGRPLAAVADAAGRLTLPVALGDDGRAEVRIAAPRRRCIRTARVPRGLQRVRARARGHRVRVRGRTVRVRVPGTRAVKLVIRGRRSDGTRVRIVRRLKAC